MGCGGGSKEKLPEDPYPKDFVDENEPKSAVSIPMRRRKRGSPPRSPVPESRKFKKWAKKFSLTSNEKKLIKSYDKNMDILGKRINNTALSSIIDGRRN